MKTPKEFLLEDPEIRATVDGGLGIALDEARWLAEMQEYAERFHEAGMEEACLDAGANPLTIIKILGALT